MVVLCQAAFAEENNDLGLYVGIDYRIEVARVETEEAKDDVLETLKAIGIGPGDVTIMTFMSHTTVGEEGKPVSYAIRLTGHDSRAAAEAMFPKLTELGYPDPKVIAAEDHMFYGWRVVTPADVEPDSGYVYRVHVMHTTSESYIESASVREKLNELGYSTEYPRDYNRSYFICVGESPDYEGVKALSDELFADGFVPVITFGDMSNVGFRYSAEQISALKAMAAELAASDEFFRMEEDPVDKWERQFDWLVYRDMQSRINEESNLIMAGVFDTRDEAQECLEQATVDGYEGSIVFLRLYESRSERPVYGVLIDCVFDYKLSEKYVEDLKEDGYGTAMDYAIRLTPGFGEIRNHLPEGMTWEVGK